MPWWIATICENTKEKALRRISWVKEFQLVRWNEYHFSAAFNLLKFHQLGCTALPETLSEYVWYAWGEVWKGTLMVADLEQVDKNNVKLNAKEVISGDNPKNRRWTIKIYWRRSGSENSNFDKESSKFEEKFKKTFLENQTGFQPPEQEVIAHQHKCYTEISDILTKIASKNIWESLSWTSSTSRLTPSITGKTSCYRSTGFVDDVFLVKLSSGTSPPTLLPHESSGSTPIPALIECESADEQARGDPSATQPIKKCRRKRVSEQKLRVHDKYGEIRYLVIFFSIKKLKTWCGRDADKDCGQVFNVT